MRRRTFVAALGATAAASVVPGVLRPAEPVIAPTLTARDRAASTNARSVYDHLVSLENAARSGTHPMTIIGQHIETQQELYNASYGDTGGTTFSGYYYKKARDLTGKLSGFVEIDLGPGYGATGWGTYGDRSYNRPLGLPTGRQQWRYADDAVDLAFGVWKGLPRPADGTYNPDGAVARHDGGTATLTNGGAASGIVGMSFHQPYPGSPRKSWSSVLTQAEGRHPGGDVSYPVATLTTDQAWFDRVVDWESDTPEYRALLADLGFLAAALSYFAAWDVPVLLRPYHEMNSGWSWWGGRTPASYRKLWRITYDYLVRTRGLHHLIFVWAPNAWNPRGATCRGTTTPVTPSSTSSPSTTTALPTRTSRTCTTRGWPATRSRGCSRRRTTCRSRRGFERPDPQPVGDMEHLGLRADQDAVQQHRGREGDLLRHGPGVHGWFGHRVRAELRLGLDPRPLTDGPGRGRPWPVMAGPHAVTRGRRASNSRSAFTTSPEASSAMKWPQPTVR